MMEIKNVYVGAVALIVSAIILSFGIASRNTTTPISVTGSAVRAVTADKVSWSGSWERTVTSETMKSGYQQMSVDEGLVKEFVKSQNVPEKDYTISTVSMNEVYDYDRNNGGPKKYTLRQNIKINSDDVNGMEKIVRATRNLVDNGLIFFAESPQYYYSKLSELRVSLLGDAIKDAKNRADVIAKAGDKKLGSIVSASSGVVQVLPPNSLEVSDYGSYDTGTIDKNVMVTVKASFSVK